PRDNSRRRPGRARQRETWDPVISAPSRGRRLLGPRLRGDDRSEIRPGRQLSKPHALANARAFFFGETEMATSSYDEALARVLEHEGGYSNDPGDPGGPTKYGITIFDARAYWKRDATAADVRAMPLDVAKRIYKEKSWNGMRWEELPAGVDYAVFDYGVNSGIGRAAKVLQRCVVVPIDGRIGPVTLAAAQRANAPSLIEQICE